MEKENQFLNRCRIYKILFACLFIAQHEESDFSMPPHMYGSNHTPRQEVRAVLTIMKG